MFFCQFGYTQNPFIQVHSSASQHYAESVTVLPASSKYFGSGYVATSQDPSAQTGSAKRYGDTRTQSRSALKKLETDLHRAGLTLEDVVNVRAYIAADKHNNGVHDYQGWQESFNEIFGTDKNPGKPTLTTLGVVSLEDPDLLVEVEIVAVYPVVKGPDTAMLFTAGHVGSDPSTKERMVDMEVQAHSAFKELLTLLQGRGLNFRDVVSMRAMLMPDKNGESDFPGWERAYDHYFKKSRDSKEPVSSVFAIGPGFSSYGYKIEIEMIAAFSDSSDLFNTNESSARNPMLITYGKPELSYNLGIAVQKHATYTWISGVPGSGEGDLGEQSVAVFAELDRRLKKAGLSWSDVVEMRSYYHTDLDIRSMFAKYRPVREQYLNNVDNPHKPVGTSLKVADLPGDAKIQIEITAVTPK